LTITSKTVSNPCAFKASYAEGKLIPESLKPCASANKGTQILVEDLFYNSSIRRNALRNSTEEFYKIHEVVSRYAIHNYHVSFFLKRLGETSTDLKTAGCLQLSNKERCEQNENVLIDDIALVYGNELKKELERISLDYDENYKFKMNGYMSNSKYTQLRQMVFILFINERLVDCQPIKKAIASVYSLYLPKNTNYFVYINLMIHPKNLDVNIHPTKHEVRFLYQDEIIQKIQSCFEDKMLNSGVSRTYLAKNLTLDPYISMQTTKANLDESTASVSTGSPKVIYPYQLSRVDSRERKLDSYLHSNATLNDSSSFRLNKENLSQENSKKTPLTPAEQEMNLMKSPLRNQALQRTFNFINLNELKDLVEKKSNKNVRRIFMDMTFVGVIERELALIQYKTDLFLTNTRQLSEELFYQLSLFNFGNFGYYKLKEPISIVDLALFALDNPETEWTPDDGSKEKLSTRCAKFLYQKKDLLDDFFSIKITKNDDENIQSIRLEALPILIENYEPDYNDLPIFVIRLATEVNWKNEKECFDSICRQLALFYSIKNKPFKKEIDLTTSSQTNRNKPDDEWTIEHVIYSAIRNMLLIGDNEEKTFLKLVGLNQLYKIFERC